jgi:hypothetical protein
MDDNRLAVLAEIKGLSAYALAQLAECASPDSPASDGAVLLTGARDSFVENVKFYADDIDESFKYGDIITEISTEMPDTYTNTLWKEFIDLCGYSEDFSEWFQDGFPHNDMEEIPRTGLRMILERMMQRFVEQLNDVPDDESDD